MTTKQFQLMSACLVLVMTAIEFIVALPFTDESVAKAANNSYYMFLGIFLVNYWYWLFTKPTNKK